MPVGGTQNYRNESMLKLVVFDCDGVLFDSMEANRVYYNHLLEHFSCPPMDENEALHVHTHNVSDSVKHIFRNHQHIHEDKINRFRESLDYADFIHHMQMEPDLPDFLKLIKPHLQTAISTNRTTTMDMVLDTFELRHWFDQVVTALDAGRPKPAPDGLLMILEHFKVQPDEVIYIGDSTVDRDHCANVGVDLIAFKNKDLEAKYHVENFMSIAELEPFRHVPLKNAGDC